MMRIFSASFVLFLGLTAISCGSASGRQFDAPLVLIQRGDWIIEGPPMFGIFSQQPDCTATAFNRILVHDDHTGCELCLSFDVTPIDGCRFIVRNVYITAGGGRREEASNLLNHYLRLLEPSNTRPFVQELSASGADSSSERYVFNVEGRSLEAHVDISRSRQRWIASAVVFRYDRAILR
jgi:hypothetical protein